jgi:hypothetical protein
METILNFANNSNSILRIFGSSALKNKFGFLVDSFEDYLEKFNIHIKNAIIFRSTI